MSMGFIAFDSDIMFVKFQCLLIVLDGNEILATAQLDVSQIFQVLSVLNVNNFNLLWRFLLLLKTIVHHLYILADQYEISALMLSLPIPRSIHYDDISIVPVLVNLNLSSHTSKVVKFEF
jgi:hypothetical protein